MNEMNMPGFTADLCLRNADQRYQVFALEHQTDQTIQPTLMGPNAPGIAGCLQDCMDAHPDWTVARCKASCRDPGVTQGSGGEYNGISRQRRYVGTAVFFVNRPRETYFWRVSAFCLPGWEVEVLAPALT
jgi:hypothetical protein